MKTFLIKKNAPRPVLDHTVKPQLAVSGLTTPQSGLTRKDRHKQTAARKTYLRNYMREYMKQRRTNEKASREG